MQPFTLLIKPSGSDCNLDCTYCFYKNRASEIGQGRQRMSIEILEKMTKDYLELHLPISNFSWQGGEPTLMGLDFYKKAVELQQKYGSDGRQISNALQTNAILLDDDWCKFLSENKFLAGISIDGPKEYHDYYRKDFAGNGSYEKVIRAIEKCKEYKVEFNALILLTNINASHPDELIDFFLDLDIKYLQFIPCAELEPETGKIAQFSVSPEQYGDFLCRTFDRWCQTGPQNLSIRDFESIISFLVTSGHTICTFGKQCHGYIVIEHTGDAFPCDFFVEPGWRLGNIFETPIEQLAKSSKKLAFNRTKQNLCDKCLLCRHLDICRGGCQKDKLGDNKRLTYFCESYKKFFDYAMPKLSQIAANVYTNLTSQKPKSGA